jgi:hypothetical protein
MDPVSNPYLFRDCHNHRFSGETFSAHGAASPDFGPMDRVSR